MPILIRKNVFFHHYTAQLAILGQKIMLFKSSFRTVANYKMPDFCMDYTPSVGKPKTVHENFWNVASLVMETLYELIRLQL